MQSDRPATTRAQAEQKTATRSTSTTNASSGGHRRSTTRYTRQTKKLQVCKSAKSATHPTDTTQPPASPPAGLARAKSLSNTHVECIAMVSVALQPGKMSHVPRKKSEKPITRCSVSQQDAAHLHSSSPRSVGPPILRGQGAATVRAHSARDSQIFAPISSWSPGATRGRGSQEWLWCWQSAHPRCRGRGCCRATDRSVDDR